MSEIGLPETPRPAVIGLGYVGLPLAVEFGRRLSTVGFDVSERRVEALRAGEDRTRELTAKKIAAAERLTLTTDPAELAACNVCIITAPTPIDAYRRPDLGPLLAASRTVGQSLGAGDVIIYESTVYPGATEEECVPVLEAEQGHGLRPRATAPPQGSQDAVILAVPHLEFVALGGEGVRRLGTAGAVVFDVKSVLPAAAADLRL